VSMSKGSTTSPGYSRNVKGTEHAVVDLYSLARSQWILGKVHSTFSVVSWLLSKDSSLEPGKTEPLTAGLAYWSELAYYSSERRTGVTLTYLSGVMGWLALLASIFGCLRAVGYVTWPQ